MTENFLALSAVVPGLALPPPQEGGPAGIGCCCGPFKRAGSVPPRSLTPGEAPSPLPRSCLENVTLTCCPVTARGAGEGENQGMALITAPQLFRV